MDWRNDVDWRNRVDWRGGAACVGEDPELFFPASTFGPRMSQAEEARSICRRCPVTTDCLVWALDAGIEDGVWGGRTEEERRTLRRRRSQTQHSRRLR